MTLQRHSNSQMHHARAAIEGKTDRYAGSHKHLRQPVKQKRGSLISPAVSILLGALARCFCLH